MRLCGRTAMCAAALVLCWTAGLAGTVSITVEPQEPEIGDAVGIIANVTLDPGETCTGVDCELLEVTCGQRRDMGPMQQDTQTRWHTNWQTLDGHNGDWEITVTAYFMTYYPPGCSEATAEKTVTVGNLVLSELVPDRPILWLNETTDLPPAFSCYVFNHRPLSVAMDLQIYDVDYGPDWGATDSVSPNTTWSVQPPAGVLEKYKIYTYKFHGEQNYADWYTNPRPIFDSLWAELEEPFDPDTGEMWVDLNYQLDETPQELTWDAYDPLLYPLSPLAPSPPPIPAGPLDMPLLYPDADVATNWPIYGGRYHWVVSGTSNHLERDHRYLSIKDEGASIVMHPKARNYDTSEFGSRASIARDAQQTLATDVPEGQYGATATTDAGAQDMKTAFEGGAVWSWHGHGIDHEYWVQVEGGGPADPDQGWVLAADGPLYAKDAPKPDGGGPHLAGPGGLVDPTQCHLAVFYCCLAGDEFQSALEPQGVDCVVGVNDALLYNGDVSLTWFETFWEDVRQGETVGAALIHAREQVRQQHPDPPPDATAWWNTDLITATAPNHRVVLARYE